MQTYFEAEEAGALADALKSTETVTLPRKNWKAPRRADFADSMRWQGLFLSSLIEAIYHNLSEVLDGGPELQSVTYFAQILDCY